MVNIFTLPTLQPAFQLSGYQSFVVANSAFSIHLPNASCDATVLLFLAVNQFSLLHAR
jgi:hypothetical protein